MTESSETVLIIDDHPLFRKGVAQLIESEGGLTVAGEAASGEEGLELAANVPADLILLDLDMKDMHGIQVLQELRRRGSTALIIILTVSDAEKDLVAALRIGADGYLLKDMEPEEMISKIRDAAQGKVVLAKQLMDVLPMALREENSPAPVLDASVTNREMQILALIADGRSNKLIARELGISDGTVKVHIRNLMAKMKLRSRLEMAVWYLGQARTQ